MKLRQRPSQIFLGVAICGIAITGFAETRPWTDVSGRTIKAELVDVSGGKAFLKMGKSQFEVPVETLSPADR